MSLDVSIKRLYEVDRQPIELIAEALDLEQLTVKESLAKHSSVYRVALKKDEPTAQEDISRAEYDEILSAYKTLALTADDESIREKSLKFLILYRKGYFDAKAKSESPMGPIQFNQIIVQARAKAQEQIEAAAGEFIDLEILK